MNPRATVATETVVALITAVRELPTRFKLTTGEFKLIALDSGGVLKRR